MLPAVTLALDGDTDIEKSTPVPVSEAVWVLPLVESSVTISAPVLVPVVVGENVTLMMQLVATARVEEQVFVWAKSPVTAMLAIFSVAVPLLLRVTFFAALVVVSLTEPQMSEVDESEATGPIPVPDRETEGAVPPALVFTVTLPVRAPRAVGVKVTLMVQEAFVASVLDPVGQLLNWAKSPTLVPLSAMLLMLSGAAPVLVTVIVCAAVVVPTNWLPKARLVGVTVTAAEGVLPDPLRGTFWVPVGSLSVITTVALRAPVAAGLNVTLMVHDALIARVLDPVGQLLVWVKSPGLVPPNPMLLMLRGAVPVLFTVIVFAALVVPTDWLA
jgi:hypothetical protein